MGSPQWACFAIYKKKHWNAKYLPFTSHLNDFFQESICFKGIITSQLNNLSGVLLLDSYELPTCWLLLIYLYELLEFVFEFADCDDTPLTAEDKIL